MPQQHEKPKNHIHIPCFTWDSSGACLSPRLITAINNLLFLRAPGWATDDTDPLIIVIFGGSRCSGTKPCLSVSRLKRQVYV